LAGNAWLDWRTSFLSNRLNGLAAFCFGLAAMVDFITTAPDFNQFVSAIIFWPLMSFLLYYGLYRARLFYFGDVKYAAVLGLVCLPRAGPLEYLSAQIISLSLVFIALAVQRWLIKGGGGLPKSGPDFDGGNSLVGAVEIRAGPYLLLGHLLAGVVNLG
jgi:prepilin signal peptidase PulO-like enzyme (type II secretory pathway)